MNVAFGTDEVTPMTDEIEAHLKRLGHEVQRLGIGLRWAEVGRMVGEAVSTGDADAGVVCCFTGTGVTMAANKVNGVRAALCVDAETARGSRRWNDANVLALSLRITTADVAREIVDAFFGAKPDGTEADQIALLP
jgi:ribose 5-phosphate isomerase B